MIDKTCLKNYDFHTVTPPWSASPDLLLRESSRIFPGRAAAPAQAGPWRRQGQASDPALPG